MSKQMSKTVTYRRWTARETEFLRTNYEALTAENIADTLERTVDSVWEKAGREGLRKHAKRHQRDEYGPWRCPKCKKTKHKAEFNESKDGRGSPYCTVCTNESQNERRRKPK